MLRVIILTTLITAFLYAYGSVLFSRGPMLRKVKRIPVQLTVLVILVLSSIYGFREHEEAAKPQMVVLDQVSDVATTAAIAPPVPPEPLHPKDAAVACVEHALDEARATEDLVAETWLSSVEDFLETAPGEVTVRFAVGPRAGPPRGRQCRSEARLTCTVTGRDVRPITPVHMTGAQIAC
jgi:hypothetical protein